MLTHPVGDTGGGGAHQDLCLRVVVPDQLRKAVFHIQPHLRRGEGQAVVAVHRAFYAAGPGKGLVRAEKKPP